ncbi:MAG: ubiquinone biosynthesis regulatory protein kinase UbiB [Pseudomonadota bacterium]
MLSLRQFLRLLSIQRTLVRYGLDEFIPTARFLRPLRFAFYLLPGKRQSDAPRGERLRLALEELGPIFVKFGQALSTRRDLLPPDISAELALLQDQVPAFDSATAVNILREAWGAEPTDVLAEFDPQPLAAASIAQVHAGKLGDGRDVVVKLLRPNMRAMIERDVDLLHGMASLAQRYWREAPRVRPIEIVEEYEKTILDELDLMREAANAAQLKRNFDGSDLLYVPEVYFDHCRRNVMVMERIYGVPISDIETLKQAGTNFRRLAANGVEIFFTQVFRHNFFHADMHPGNIFVQIDNPEFPRYAAVDFGIVGTLDPIDQNYLAGNFLAFFDRDYYRVAKLHVDSGWVPRDTRVDELEGAVRTVCEPIFNKPLSEISFGQVLLRLFETARRFNMNVQPQLILLQKTLLNIEGLGRDLYPELDLWETAQPILREWMTERLGGRAALRELRSQWPDLQEALREMPGVVKRLADSSESGRLKLTMESDELTALRREWNESARRQRQFNLGMMSAGGGVALLALTSFAWVGGAVVAAGVVAMLWSSR